MSGSYKAWNSVAAEMRDPRPFYSLENTPGMPEALAHGQRYEPMACAEFWERHPEYEVLDPKFVRWHAPEQRALYDLLAYSPDRMLACAGHTEYVAGLETKCPYNGEVHAETLGSTRLPTYCKWQVLHGMRVAGVDEWWFVSLDPRVTDPAYRYYEHHVLAADYRKATAEMVDKLNEFIDGYTSGQSFVAKNPKAQDFERMF